MSLLLGMILDALMGEPRWLWSRVPHPAVLMGNLIAYGDRKLNHGISADRKLKGAALMAALVIGAGLIGLLIEALPGYWADIICIAILLAQRSLVEHVQAVANAITANPTDLGPARHAVSMIVGRDTREMSEDAISRAAIESAAENFSDGVIAPIFWCVIGGIPGLLMYKITNTADSMIGYRTARYEAFGWAAARFDDLLNLAPARITALLLWLPSCKGQWSAIAHEARQHRSPNAGWPEAALARKLNIALAGPRSYEGIIEQYPWVNPKGTHHIGPNEIKKACSALWVSWGIVFTACVSLF